MRTIFKAVSFITCLVVAPSANATSPNEEIMKDVEVIEVIVPDTVIDGCLLNSEALRTKAELVLRSSGIKVDQSMNSADIRGFLNLTTTGYLDSSNRCIAFLNIELSRNVWTEKYGDASVQIFSIGVLLSVPKSGMQSRLVNAVDNKVSELANEMLRLRQQ